MTQTGVRSPVPPFTRKWARELDYWLIKEIDRKFHWARDNNGRRPDDHASLSALGL